VAPVRSRGLASVPARSGLVKDLLPSEDAASAQSLLSSIGQGTRILSPVIGTAIYAAFGGSTLAVIDAATFVIAIAALLSIRVAESPVEASEEPFRRRLTAGFRYVHTTRLLWQLTIALTAFLAVAGLLETGLFAAIQYGIHRPPSFYGILLSLQGAGTIAGAVLASKVVKAIGEARTTGIGAIGAGIGLALGIVVPSVATFLIGMFVCGASLGLMFVAFGTAQQLYTPGRLTGRVAAAMGTLMSLSQTISIAIGAIVVAFIDWRLMFGLTALTGLICGLTLILRPAPTPAIVTSIADQPMAEEPTDSAISPLEVATPAIAAATS
jgi:MFS family permease